MFFRNPVKEFYIKKKGKPKKGAATST